ncbi:hypothetical protein EDB62_12070 [Vibrio crassostreae]|nr:hypothetical protein EDB62_12070 [Vibrio crassostreae]TWD64997.1 hypothetical protein FB445_11970 [Vibrio crassostreae]
MKKLALITGSKGGIGSAISAKLVADGGVVDQISLKVNDAICDSPLASNRHA